MKNSKALRRISVLVVAILLITLSAVSATFAKYSTTITGSGDITTAAWAFTVSDNSEDYTFALTADKMAPGNSQTIDLVLQNNGEVDADCVLTLTAPTSTPDALTFALSAEEVTVKAGTTETITLTIDWEYTDAVENTYASTNYEFSVQVVADSVTTGM